MSSDPVKKVPVTIITGFLGSGKTTLLQYILSANHGYRIAVVQNEFSEQMGIESPTLVDSTGELVDGIFELPNGCICCSVRDDMVASLDSLLTRFPGKFDYVLVETTGVSDPEPVATAFWVDEGLQSNLRLDGIVTLVDLQHFDHAIGLADLATADLDQNLLAKLAEQNDDRNKMDSSTVKGLLGLQREAIKQVAAADRVLLNKADVATDEQKERVTAAVRGLNPVAEVFQTTRSQVDLARILGLKAFEPDTLKEKLGKVQLGQAHHCDGDACTHAHHTHDAPEGADVNMQHASAHGGVESCLVTLKQVRGKRAMDAELLEPVLGDLIWGREAGTIYRCKGLFYGLHEDDDDEGRIFRQDAVCVLQGVGESFEVVPLKNQAKALDDYFTDASGNKTDEVEAKFLFVGLNLDKDLIREQLEQLLVDVPKDLAAPAPTNFDE